VTDIEQLNDGLFFFSLKSIRIFSFLELCQTQSPNDAQHLADTLQILTIVIPHVHETILNTVNNYFDSILFDFFAFSILIYYLIYLDVYHRNTQSYDF
jgi:hypothetical protein